MRDDWIFFRTIISVNQLSIYGAVSDLCDECKSCPIRTGWLELAGQSDHCLNQQVWWKHRHLRPMTLSKKIYCKSTKNQWRGVYNKNVMKFCIDAGFLTMAGVGQYFMTRLMKNSHNLLRQGQVVSTLCQEVKNHVTRKVGFEGTLKLGPCWKSQPAIYKVNLEWKLEWPLFTDSILTRGSQIFMAWTRWSRTSSTTKRTTTISRKPMRLAFASRIEAEAKPQRRNHASSSTRNFTRLGKKEDLLRQEIIRQSLTHCENNWVLFFVKVIYLKQDWAIEFLESKDYLWNKFVRTQHWSDEMWKSRMTQGWGNKKIFQSFSDSSGGILYFQALQSHLGRNRIDPSLEGFLQAHLSCRMFNQFTRHREFRIDTKKTKFEQNTDGIIHVCVSDEQGT